jgi:hypothetical protein
MNAMLGSWNNERLMCYAVRDESLTMIAAQASYTVGPAGILATTRPVEIADAYVVVSNISYSVRIMNESEYASIPDKTATAAYPDHIYYQPSMSAGTVYVYPVPNATSALHLLTQHAPGGLCDYGRYRNAPSGVGGGVGEQPRAEAGRRSSRPRPRRR